MKRISLFIFIAIITIVGMQSCGDESINYGQKNGKVSLNLKDNLHPEITRANSQNDFSMFEVAIFNSEDNKINSWEYINIPDIVELEVGEYYVTMTLEQPIISEQPAYMGKSENFTVTKGDVSRIDVICKMTSLRVELDVDEELSELLNDTTQYIVGIGTNEKIMTKAELKTIYFNNQENPLLVHVSIKGSTTEGESIQTSSTYEFQNGENKLIPISIKNITPGTIANNGKLTPVVTINNEVVKTTINGNIPQTEEIIEEEEDVVPPTPDEAPQIVGVGFNIDESREIPTSGQVDCRVKITTSKGIKSLMVQISSPTLTPELLESKTVGLTDKLDLSNPGDKKESIKGLGLPVAENVVGQTNLEFNLSEFMPLLRSMGAGTHKFIITAEDNAGGRTIKTLTIITK